MQPACTGVEPGLIHVALVEDDPDFLEVLSEVVRAAPDMRLSGVAGTCAEGLAMIDGPPVDVLLVDLGLPDGSGIAIIRAAARHWSRCNIMVSTNFGDEAHVMHSLEAGAAGYLLKDSSAARIADEIRSLAAGGSPISPIIARQILTRFREIGAAGMGAVKSVSHVEPALLPPLSSPLSSPLSLLSPRENEVLDFIIKGFTAQEIAKLMQLSHFTVRTFVRRIYDKLKVSSKAEAIYEARQLGWLDH